MAFLSLAWRAALKHALILTVNSGFPRGWLLALFHLKWPISALGFPWTNTSSNLFPSLIKGRCVQLASIQHVVHLKSSPSLSHPIRNSFWLFLQSISTPDDFFFLPVPTLPQCHHCIPGWWQRSLTELSLQFLPYPDPSPCAM